MTHFISWPIHGCWRWRDDNRSADSNVFNINKLDTEFWVCICDTHWSGHFEIILSELCLLLGPHHITFLSDTMLTVSNEPVTELQTVAGTWSTHDRLVPSQSHHSCRSQGLTSYLPLCLSIPTFPFPLMGDQRRLWHCWQDAPTANKVTDYFLCYELLNHRFSPTMIIWTNLFCQ